MTRSHPRARLPRARTALCVLAAGLVHTQHGAQAQLPEPKLNVVAPAGARASETVPVKITGTSTDDPALLFSHPGIQAVRDAKVPTLFNVSVAADVPPGAYDVRVLGKFGVSNPRRFEVGKFPEVEASPKALTKAESQELAVPCVVHGNAAKQQVQWFKLPGAKGTELVLDCRAWDLDSRMDPLLVLHDETGRELARSRRRPLRWTPPADQPLFVSLRDFISNGGPEHFYRLHVGTGKDLPAAEPARPLLLWPNAAKALDEAEPNDPAHPQKTVLPLEVRGRFGPARDVDAFSFEAKKGEEWWVECVSSRLGLPTHPRVVIERVTKSADGAESFNTAVELADSPWFSGDPDFDGLHFDPIGKFAPKEDGTYRLTVRDLNNHTEGGPARSYALSIRKPDPDFALVCAVQTPIPNKGYATANGPVITVRAANLRPGQTLPMRVLVVRRDGFQGRIQLSAENLPAGVTADACFIGTDQSEGTLLLRAAPDAPKWAGPIRISGRASIAETERVRTARCSTPLWESTAGEFLEPGRGRFAEELALAVVEDAPVTSVLRVEQEQLESKPNDKLKLALRIDRPAPAGAPVKLKIQGLPGADKAKPKDAEVPANEARTEYELDLAPFKLSPGTYMVWFRGDDKIKRDVAGKPGEVTVNLCSNPLTLTIKEPSK